MSVVKDVLTGMECPEIRDRLDLKTAEGERRFYQKLMKIGEYAYKGYDIGVRTLQVSSHHRIPRMMSSIELPEPFLLSAHEEQGQLQGFKVALQEIAPVYDVSTVDVAHMAIHPNRLNIWAISNKTSQQIGVLPVMKDVLVERSIDRTFDSPEDFVLAVCVGDEITLQALHNQLS